MLRFCEKQQTLTMAVYNKTKEKKTRFDIYASENDSAHKKRREKCEENVNVLFIMHHAATVYSRASCCVHCCF